MKCNYLVALSIVLAATIEAQAKALSACSTWRWLPDALDYGCQDNYLLVACG